MSAAGSKSMSGAGICRDSRLSDEKWEKSQIASSSFRYSQFVTGRLLDFDAVIVFWTDPVHAAGHTEVFHDLGGHHSGTALRTDMCVGFTLVAKACARRLGYLFCHCGHSSSGLLVQKSVKYIDPPGFRQ